MRQAPGKTLSTLLLLGSLQVTMANDHLAPEWDISEWINGDGVTLEELKGKLVVVEFFQLWCPGCNRFSIPLMQKWGHKYAHAVETGQLRFLSIHTVFEGHDHQSPARLKAFLKKKEIHHLVGIDRLKSGERTPETMQRYKTRGTPEIAIIDPQGKIRFQHFGGFDPAEAESLIEILLKESGS